VRESANDVEMTTSFPVNFGWETDREFYAGGALTECTSGATVWAVLENEDRMKMDFAESRGVKGPGGRADENSEWSALARQSVFRVDGLAELMRCSPRQLQRRFKRVFGQSPKAWLDDRRAEEAILLLGANAQIKVVASSLGFRDCPQFCAWFRKRFGITPCEWRDLQREEGRGGYLDERR